MDPSSDQTPAGPSPAGKDLFAFLEALPLPVIVGSVDDSTVVYANRSQLEAMCAASLDEVVGRAASDFVHPSQVDRVAAMARELIGGSPSARLNDLKVVKCDGSEGHVDLHAVLMTLDGRPVSVMISVDLTDRILLERQMAASR
jgi:PAS domain S-box-containing protein